MQFVSTLSFHLESNRKQMETNEKKTIKGKEKEKFDRRQNGTRWLSLICNENKIVNIELSIHEFKL